MSFGWPSPFVQRPIQQAIQNYGPGSAFNNNAWIQAATQNPFSVPTRITTPQPSSAMPSITTPTQISQLLPRQASVVPSPATFPGLPFIPSSVGQTIQYPNGSQTTYDIMPPKAATPAPNPVQQIINATWGKHAGPGVSNEGNLINAEDDLGLGPFMKYIQNIATNPAHETNLNQFHGNAPVAAKPPVTTTPPKTTTPTPTPTPTPTAPKPATPAPTTGNVDWSGWTGSRMQTSLPNHVVARYNGRLVSIPVDRLPLYHPSSITIQPDYAARFPGAVASIGTGSKILYGNPSYG